MSKSTKGKKARPRKSGQWASASAKKPNWAADEYKAQLAADLNKAQIFAGETFAAGRRSGPEKSPSSNRDGHYA